jgi:hypothetical protein
MEKGAAVLQDGARRFSFKADDFLPLHFGVSQRGRCDATPKAVLSPIFLLLPGGTERQSDCKGNCKFEHGVKSPDRCRVRPTFYRERVATLLLNLTGRASVTAIWC